MPHSESRAAPDRAQAEIVPFDGTLHDPAPDVVMDALRDTLFGPIDGADGIGCFAILDAAANPFLPELLETSGLTARCLYDGDAETDFAEAAPWLVELRDGDPFTTRLFTAGDASWHLWARGLGVLLRSDGTFKELRAHLRHFTKVRDSADKWYFFRFWDRATSGPFFGGLADGSVNLAAWRDMGDGLRLRRVLVPGLGGGLQIIDLPPPVADETRKPFSLRQTDADRMGTAVRLQAEWRLAGMLVVAADPLRLADDSAGARDRAALTFARLLHQDASALGIDAPRDLERIARLSRVFGRQFHIDPRLTGTTTSPPVAGGISDRFYAILDARAPLSDLLLGPDSAGGLSADVLNGAGTLPELVAAMRCDLAPDRLAAFHAVVEASPLPLPMGARLWACFYLGHALASDPRYAGLWQSDPVTVSDDLVALAAHACDALRAEPLARPL